MRRGWMCLWVCMMMAFVMSACGKNGKQQVALELIDVGEQSGSEDKDSSKDADNAQKGSVSDQIYVYVCGAVNKPGVYAVPKNSRIYEAIQMAGGFTGEAATVQINQAELLEDEAYVYVPTNEEVASGAVTGKQTGQDAKVDLNRATKEELMSIPGVGEAKAGQILQYREEHGKFRKIEDIMNISGIKEGLFEKIKSYIKV